MKNDLETNKPAVRSAESQGWIAINRWQELISGSQVTLKHWLRSLERRFAEVLQKRAFELFDC
jgi:hypothetical protein